MQAVARNVAPLAGVLLLGWNARNVVYLYFVDTLFAMAVILAGVLRHMHPPVTTEGVAARLNSEAGVLAGGLAGAALVGLPLAFGLAFMFEFELGIAATLADPGFQVAVAWQVAAALSSYASLAAALQTRTPDELRLRRRFALVFLRWIALLWLAQFTAVLSGPSSAIAFVAVYAVLSTWTEIAPDQFLRVMPGGTDAPPVAAPPPAKRRKRR